MTAARRFVAGAVLGAALLVCGAKALPAQGVRVTGVSHVQLVELRRFVIDSVAASEVPGTGEWRTTADGVPILCPALSAWCRVQRSGDRVSDSPALQDITVAAWGWREGFSVHADLRARTRLGGGSAFTFPRGDDHLDVLSAYAELDRAAWRARLGRQWVTGGLGAYDFDGAALLARRDAWSVEGWAGRALMAGLNDPYPSAQLEALDNLPPREEGWVFGVRGRFRPDPLTAASVIYQRVLIGDRSGLYSQRAALNASTRRYGLALDLGLAYDFASGDWNEARLRASAGVLRDVHAAFEVRHSRPFFELWTIWGAFAPVGFGEVRSTVDWVPRGAPYSFTLRGAWRRYGDTHAGLSLRTNGWRAGADAHWRGTGAFSGSASYDVDIGSGAANTDVRAGARWTGASERTAGIEASVTQNIHEFRVGTGRVHGLAVNASVPLRDDLRIAGDVGLYQHALSNGAPGPDWTQRRATLRLEWSLGRDPGAATAGTP